LISWIKIDTIKKKKFVTQKKIGIMFMNDSSENNLENIAKIAGVSIDVVRKIVS